MFRLSDIEGGAPKFVIAIMEEPGFSKEEEGSVDRRKRGHKKIGDHPPADFDNQKKGGKNAPKENSEEKGKG